MADDQFLVDLAEATSLEMTDIIYSVINPGTVPVDRKIKISNLAASIKLDDLGAPDDNTDLNATISAHGLLPKLSGSANDALRGDGSWGQVSSGAGADGWSAISGSFAYASGSTITVPSGAASIYAVGDKLKLTQTTVKYFYIVTVADTLLTITGGSDYALANAAITDVYYSHGGGVGHPVWFNYAPAFTGFSTDPVGIHRFSIIGRTVNLIFRQISGTSNSTAFTMTAPVTNANMPNAFFVAGVDNNTDTLANAVLASSSTTITLYKNVFTAWTNSGTKYASAQVIYQI